MDYAAKHVAPLIRKYGWMIQGVGADDEALSFAYTIGLNARSHPELLVFGLPSQAYHPILNELAGRVVRGGDVLPLRQPIGDVASYPLQLVSIARAYRTDQYQFFNVARNYYRTVIIDAVQLVWPDAAGRFPWEGGFDVRLTTPLLDTPGLAGYKNPKRRRP